MSPVQRASDRPACDEAPRVRGLSLAAGLCVAVLLTAPPAHAQDAPKGRPAASKKKTARPPVDAAPAQSADDAATAEEANERRGAERFATLLEKSPRRGTALDRVYGYHVERGTLDTLVKTYQNRTVKDPKDGAAWMILGLLESQRGRDAAGVDALTKAEASRADDPLASYYLGQALVLVGKPDEAAAAMERAIERKPRRNDLLEIFQALGRVYQRSQKNDKALAVWARLEALFPADVRVQEQIASALAEEGQAEQALPRFEALAKKVTDPFRQVQLATQAADLKVKLGKTDVALRDYETLLGKLRPDSWLFREVRRKVDDVFLRNDDQAGLAAYYEAWVAKNPEDIEAVLRLARTLSGLGKAAESRNWFDKAVALAPTRRDLRLALIAQLGGDQKFGEAAAQFEALDKAEPGNPDTLRGWGSLLLRDASKPEAERKTAAGAVWKRLLDARPNDPVTAAQVADLFRQAEMTDDALALYRKAVSLAPGNPQYHEYLGEYLHTLKRPADAQAAWAKIVEGENRTSRNLGRLGEVLSGFGYLKEAVGPTAEAVKLEGDDFTLRLKLAELYFKVENYADARAQLAAAGKLAEKDEEKTAVLDAEVKNDQAAETTDARVAELSKAAEAGEGGAETWVKLARYLEAEGKLPDAVKAAVKATAASPRSVVAWTLLARVRESAGNLGEAADAFRKLGEIDRRNRTEYLTGVAKLESRLGRTEEALKAGRDVIAASPGNPEGYQFFADLCFSLGKNDEGLDALRRAVRVNANDTKVVLTFAETLAGQFRTDEAIEMYWRAFDKAEGLDGRVGVVSKLTELYLQRNQLDRLLARLQRQDQDSAQAPTAQQQRESSILLAQAYASSGDLGAARTELERLLATNARDAALLQQIGKLAEDEGDVEGALKYQKQLAEVSPSDEANARLAQLYARSGEVEQAQALWSKSAARQADPAKIFQAVDSLLASDKPRAALEVTEGLLRKDARDWEALYRDGVALSALKRPEDAARRFEAILDLPVDDDQTGALRKARSRDPKLRVAGARPSAFAAAQADPLEQRLNMVYQIRSATKLETREVYYAQGSVRTSWAPGDFGEARMAALGWLLAITLEKGKNQDKAMLTAYKEAAAKTPPDVKKLWDWYYLSVVRTDMVQTYEAARALSKSAPADPRAQSIYLRSLAGRLSAVGRRTVNSANPDQDKTPPLPPAEVDHALAAYRTLRKLRPDLVSAAVVTNLTAELKRAKRTDEVETLYRDSIDSAEKTPQLLAALGLASARGDVDALTKLADKLVRNKATPGPFVSGNVYFEGWGNSLARGMALRSDEKAFDDVLRLLDYGLAASRRRHDEAQANPRARTRNASMYPAGNTLNYSIWVGKRQQGVQFAFPKPDAYLDADSITLLRTAYEAYKRADLSSDLVAHFRKQADAAPTPPDALYPRLALSAILWWDEDKEAALAEYTRAADLTNSDPEMRLGIAELYQQQGDAVEALAQADSFQPSDNTVTQRREELALRLAVRVGNTERARQAAERLFGLRLDSDTQVRLSEQMHQLGMHEMAEAVLGRARRRAGNKASALVGLMLQYQRQQKNDVAVQVAMQILRSSTPTRQSNPNVYNPDEPDAARASAVQVLARSGKLDELIARANEQLVRTPGSAQLRLTLSDYYRAAGQREKAAAELKKLAETRPDDTNLRLNIAAAFAQDGQPAVAVEHYSAVLKKDPALLARNYNQVVNAYQQANKNDELVAILEKADIKTFGQSYMVMNMIQNLMNNDQSRDQAMSLFRKAWDAFPQERSNMFSYLYREEAWQMPGMYEYARQAFLPDADSGSFSLDQQWDRFQQILSYGGDGKVVSLVSRLLDLSTGQGKLDELDKDIQAAAAKFPDWTAGKVLLAMIRCRTGRYDEAKALLKPLLATKTGEIGSMYPEWILGAELENYAETKELARTFYERSVANRNANDNSQIFEYGPGKRLVSMYTAEQRKDDARVLLLDMAKPPKSSDSNNQEYEVQKRVQTLSGVAQQLVDLGFPGDAVMLYRESAEIAETISPDGPNFIGNLQYVLQQSRDGLEACLNSLRGDQLAPAVAKMLAPRAAPKAAKADGPAKPDAPAVDLALLVAPRELNKAAVRSLFAESLSGVAKDPVQLRSLDGPVQALVKAHPDDLSVRVAAAVTALASDDLKAAESALDALNSVVQKSPLETLPGGGRANARQRAEAARQLPVWLAARACWDKADALTKSKPDAPADAALVAAAARLSAAAEGLSARAAEAAARQADNRWSLAMLRERGQRALDRGDKAAAEADWARMLDLVLNPVVRKKPAEAAPGGPMATPVAPLAPARPAPPPTPSSSVTRPVRPISYKPQQGVTSATFQVRTTQPGMVTISASPGTPVQTLDRFDQAMQVAQLAAENGMHALSFKAVRESLKGGPPMAVANEGMAQRRMVRMSGAADLANPGDARVVAVIGMLDPVWKAKGAPAAEVYNALKDVVLPAARPNEIFLYPQAIPAVSLANNNGLSGINVPSVGATLARWAVMAGKADELKTVLVARSKQPQTELPAAVLRAQLALAASDDAGAVAALKELSARSKRDTLRGTAVLICHPALAAINRPGTADAALDALDAAADNLAASTSADNYTHEPQGSILLLVARNRIKRGDSEAGRKRMASYLETVDHAYTRYNGDYSVYQRKLALQRIAAEYARAGLTDDALKALGQYADTVVGQNYGVPSQQDGDAFGLIARQLADKPAQARYDALRAFTIPDEPVKALRMVPSYPTDEAVPELFTGVKAPKGPPEPVHSVSALVAAARDAGKLDALGAELLALADRKVSVENAREALWLLEVERGRGSSVREALATRLAERVKEYSVVLPVPNGPPNMNNAALLAARNAARTFPLLEEQVARAAAAQGDPVLRNLGIAMLETLVKRAQSVNAQAGVGTMLADLAAARARSQGSESAATPSADPLAHWHTTVPVNTVAGPAGPNAPWWVAHEGHVAQVSGPAADILRFDYPLAGTYELSADTLAGPNHTPSFSAHGLAFDPFQNASVGGVSVVGGYEIVNRAARFRRPHDYNRLTLQASPGKLRVLLNGHLFYEDTDPGATSPWLGLLSKGSQGSVWKNARLTGAPEIPRQIKLVEGKHLEGWVSTYYGESTPPRLADKPWNVTATNLLTGQTNARSRILQTRVQPTSPDQSDWSAADGVLRGRNLSTAANALAQAQANQGNNQAGPASPADTVPSRLYYQRPLRDGDSVSYAFRYVPDQVVVHPSLGRYAFLIEPAGVKLHWITSALNSGNGPAVDNAVDEPQYRKGTGPLPLKADDWNTVTLRLDGRNVTLALNGVTIYERPVDPGQSTQFGFYHDKNKTSSEVRDIVLEGRWPESLTDAVKADLLAAAPGRPDGEADRRARHALVGEPAFSASAGELLRETASLKPPERLTRLAAWVLPSPDHPVVRLSGAFTPTDPAPPSAGQTPPPASPRGQSGGSIESPARAMVSAAKEAGKLDDLETRVTEIKTSDDASARGRLALFGLIQLTRGDEARAAATIAELAAKPAAADPDAPVWTRWPELTLADAAVETSAAPRKAALAMLDGLVAASDKKSPDPTFTLHAHNTRARGRLLAKAEADASTKPFNTEPDAPGWSRVVHARAETRGPGAPLARWGRDGGEFIHDPGHSNDLLYLNTPLRGDFQLDCELSTFDGREIKVSYGGLAVGPKPELKALERLSYGRALPQAVISPPLEKLGDWYKYRLAVKHNRLTVSINGRQVHEAAISGDGDPWLALHAFAQSSGRARGLTISGDPTVPESLKLSALPDLNGWIADYYQETLTGTTPDWLKQGSEVVGNAKLDTPGGKLESVLRYNRPVLEDGEITYEFFYEPGKVMTHPALDRLVFLLDREGVKIHWLTDAGHDRTGLAPDNASVESETRRGPASLPLKSNDWNALSVSITGDRASIKLNGQAVAERALEPGNARIFGLFHFADETEARVRNVVYRGQWPRSLPESLRAGKPGSPPDAAAR